ncbi:efflux RND transporter permease subunit [bacterium]|nr:efflux RND transporter permease subunit [bacterium]
MFLTKLAINRPKLLMMVVLALAIFGVLSYFSLPVALMPETELPFVTVVTVYPGASPKEIETLISKPIEDAVSIISGIKELTSVSQENVSIVFLEFEAYVDVNIAKQDVKDNIDAILTEFPDDAELPVVRSFEAGAEAILELSLTGEMSTKDLYEYMDKYLRDRLAQVKGVAELEISGGQAREIHVKLNRRILEGYSLSLMQVVGFLAQQNMDIPGGYIQEGSSEYNIRLDGKFHSLEEIRETEIPTAFGRKKLKDIAEVTDSQEEVRSKAKFFAKDLENPDKLNTINIALVKTSDANEVETAELAKKEVEGIRNELPSGMALYISEDYSLFTRGALNDTVSNIIIGIILTALILMFFLHDFRSTFIVSLAMPISIVTTFILIQASGFTLNMLTLMGLSISVGILVTNSIVVIENIYRHAITGENMRQSSLTGTTEIAIAVASTTLTNVVVFLPIATMRSIVGQIFKQFGLTLTYATLISLLVSFTVTPMLATLILKSEKIKKLGNIASLSGISKIIETLMRKLERFYHNILDYVLHRRGTQLLIVIITIIILIFSLGLFRFIGGEFMPFIDMGDISITIEMPTNYNLEKTSSIVGEIENRLRKIDEVETISLTVGTAGFIEQGQNLARIKVGLIDHKERNFTSRQFASRLRRLLSDIPDADIRISAVSPIGAGPGDAIQLDIMGQELDKVVELANELLPKFEKIPGAINIDTDYNPGKPEVRVVPDRVRLADAGVSTAQLAMELRSGIEGTIASRYREKGYEYDIKVKMADADKTSPEMVGQIPIATMNGIMRLEQLADIEFTEASTSIRRRDKFTTITITMGAEGRSTSEVLSDVYKVIDETDFPSGYKTVLGGEADIMQESNREMLRAFILAIILTYMLLVSILESFFQPFIIFFTIPLAMIGVMGSLFITGLHLNMITIMSTIMLVGIVVNNAILLIDYTNVLRGKGQKLTEALVNACPVKLKPIVMSTLAIALGMTPLALGIGSYGVEMRQSMGIVTIGGLIISAIFTLIIIPILYKWFSRGKRKPDLQPEL